MRRRAGLLLVLLMLGIMSSARAHQLVLGFGYANSGEPEHGADLSDNVFDPGGGYAFSTRVDIQRRNFVFGPALTFWNNLTGDPDPNANARYLQFELGGRAGLRTMTVPELYGGVGLGYTFAQGEFVPKFFGTKETFDGDFPTGSVHFGAKTPTRTYGVGLIGEASYHFGLDTPRGRESVGPARAFVIQIGFAFDIRLASAQAK